MIHSGTKFRKLKSIYRKLRYRHDALQDKYIDEFTNNTDLLIYRLHSLQSFHLDQALEIEHMIELLESNQKVETPSTPPQLSVVKCAFNR
jgi:hypothetical protein